MSGLNFNTVPFLDEKIAAGSRSKLRAGYIGHLTLIANKLADAAVSRDNVARALGAAPGWQAWYAFTSFSLMSLVLQDV